MFSLSDRSKRRRGTRREVSVYAAGRHVDRGLSKIDEEKDRRIPFQLGTSRYRAPEVLFNPELIGEECEGIHEILSGSIQRSDMDLRRTLYQNIVLSGGSTLSRGKRREREKRDEEKWSLVLGFGDRLLTELKRSAPKEVKIKISAPRERLYSTWIG